ncbi:hypothetical protein [Candidatus Nitrosacidococcus tergens]|uniref:PLL-like beta propeller domain-containing protein n=1 Tax=Candidatus Nitrosacidococcus tergens TaxID=553981 RepID=A0A7G1QA13_9GAMM|nr:hypothetical protein [Candidatus Nitrosacidococcus tergens]CAB1276142.1 protein of unknown function [Candidatus Nitrosacidococcus tergens]
MAGNGNDGHLQVIGLGTNGAYLVAWQDAQGNWNNAQDGHWDLGGKFAGQTAQITSLVVGNGNGGYLQVIGLGTDGSAYLVAWQDAQGNWSAGRKLASPPPGVKWSTLAVGNGNKGYLQVIGLGTDGSAYLVAWQDAQGNWTNGRLLAIGWVPLPDYGLRSGPNSVIGLAVGYDTYNVPFLTAVLQEAGDVFSFWIPVNGDWMRIPYDAHQLFGWAPALVPFSSHDRGIHRGVYASRTNVVTIGDRGILGQNLADDGKYCLGKYTQIATANGNQGYSAVFALCDDDQGIYYLYPGNPNDHQLSRLKLSGDTAILSMAAGSDCSGLLEVFAISSDRLLYHCRQDSKDPQKWEFFLKLNTELTFSRLVVSKNPAGFSDLFAVTTSNDLYHIWQDPESRDWHFDEIELSTRGKIEEFSSYSVLMSVYDGDGVPAINTKVRVFSDDPVTIEINGSTTFIDMLNPWTGTTNSGGQIAIAMKTESLGVPPLTVWTNFMPVDHRIAVDPSAPVQATLSKIDADTLQKATWTADDGTQTLLLPNHQDGKTLQSIVGAVTSAMSLAQTAPSTIPMTTNRVHQRTDPRVARYIQNYDDASAGRIHLASVPEQS